MWSSQRVALPEKSSSRVLLLGNGVPLSFSETLSLLQGSEDFRFFITATLLDSPFKAFFWETPPVAATSIKRPFEFVQVDAPALYAIQPDPKSFSPQFTNPSTDSILSFPNLGGDALLIVPRPIGDLHCYAHFASFLRQAPLPQVHEFWQVAAKSLEQRLSSSPCWLSTAGLGVSWLHLRIDSRPKYYRHAPYKSFP